MAHCKLDEIVFAIIFLLSLIAALIPPIFMYQIKAQGIEKRNVPTIIAKICILPPPKYSPSIKLSLGVLEMATV
jgi:hypothetical protein